MPSATLGVRFVNINLADLDGHKLSGQSVVADAREALQALTTQLAGGKRTRRARVELATWQRAWEGAVTTA